MYVGKETPVCEEVTSCEKSNPIAELNMSVVKNPVVNMLSEENTSSEI